MSIRNFPWVQEKVTALPPPSLSNWCLFVWGVAFHVYIRVRDYFGLFLCVYTHKYLIYLLQTHDIVIIIPVTGSLCRLPAFRKAWTILPTLEIYVFFSLFVSSLSLSTSSPSSSLSPSSSSSHHCHYHHFRRHHHHYHPHHLHNFINIIIIITNRNSCFPRLQMLSLINFVRSHT